MDRRYFFKTLDTSINNSLRHKEFISQTDKLIKKFKPEYIDWIFYDIDKRRTLREIKSPAYQLLWFAILSAEDSIDLLSDKFKDIKNRGRFYYVIDKIHNLLILDDENEHLLLNVEKHKAEYLNIQPEIIRFSKYIDKILESSDSNNYEQTTLLLSRIGEIFQDLDLILDLLFVDLSERTSEEILKEHYIALWFSLLNHPNITSEEISKRINLEGIPLETINILFQFILSKSNDPELYKKIISSLDK